MTILLDIDGVLVTTPSWKSTEQLPDGFLKFNERATGNLVRLIDMTRASIVLTTTHRVNYTIEQWKELFEARGIQTSSITKINELTSLKEIAMIMKLLGHNDIKTTLRYLHVTNRDMLQIMSPLDDLNLD